jgi:hypothetical protein
MRKLFALGFSAAVLAITQYDASADPLPRWMECVNPVTTFVASIGAVSPEADPEIAALIESLVALYRFDEACKIRETELPLAIQAAADATFDADTKALYLELYQQIMDCEFAATAAIADPPASPA